MWRRNDLGQFVEVVLEDFGIRECVRALVDFLAQLQADVEPVWQEDFAVDALGSSDYTFLVAFVCSDDVCTQLCQRVAELSSKRQNTCQDGLFIALR